jgi:aspartyl-tRNA(Asn)/glutamyl-tRNA(Gln) amidotransferase subunit A
VAERADRLPRSGFQPSPSARELAERIARREISAVDAVGDALGRIAHLDGALAAFCALDKAQALTDAAAMDARIHRGEAVGVLAGVPVAIKDLISTRGLRTTFGSPLYGQNVPVEDDVVVERLRQAGAIVVGKTNTSEFGYGPVGHNRLFPTTRNPWNLELTPGGSSAGSAVAVAAGMVPLALGSDGGGSIRIPGALTGVFGIKPSWGRVPVYPGCRDDTAPGASGWESLEHIGPLTRTVADAALALSVLAGPTSRDRHSLPFETVAWADLGWGSLRGARIAFSADLGFARVDPEVAAIAETAARNLAAGIGAQLTADHPNIGDTQDTFEALVAMDTDRNGLRAMAKAQDYSFSGALAALLSRDWSADEFTAAILARKRIANAMWRFMERYEFLLTPTAAVAAFAADRDGPETIDGAALPSSAWTPFSAVANLTGQPAASVPAGRTADGRPVGLQIIGRHLDDVGVLRLSAALEAVAPWAGDWPAPRVARLAS